VGFAALSGGFQPHGRILLLIPFRVPPTCG
jgi:hypothetical protein